MMQEAKMREAIAKWENAQYRRAAQEALHEGALRARERYRDANLLLSSLQARAAASGGGATNPTVFALGEAIAGRGAELGAFDKMAAGREARTLLNKGAASIFESQLGSSVAGMKAASLISESRTAGIGQMLGGAGSFLGGLGKSGLFSGAGSTATVAGSGGGYVVAPPAIRVVGTTGSMSGASGSSGYRGYR
jgi:hypothetical protein